MDVAIYSTYCGTSSNKTFNPQPVESDYRHFFVSNNQDILSESLKVGYTPIYLQMEVSDNPVLSAYQAKVAKVLPNLIEPLSAFEFLFYKDDKIIINPMRMNELIQDLLQNEGALSIRPHPFLNGNILFEFGEAMLQPRYKSQWEQTVAYLTEEISRGAKLECQMYWTSAILRNMKHPDVTKINQLWWEHIKRCGIECQISFNIIAQKFNTIKMLPLGLE